MKWNIACYIRISREDGDNFENDSIINQRKMLTQYVDQNFEESDYEFYIDENVTGTKFDRDQFNRMLENIQKGIINCIIVKDLSRFGRNYIYAGMLLEDFFPKHNVRFISILDNMDTFTDEDASTGLIVRIKNLMHDNNSREISRKVRASHALMRRQGKHISHAVYGYMKDPYDKYKLVVDTNVAHVIKWIFEWYADGIGVIRIAQKLNAMGIAPCAEYRRTRCINSTDETKTWRPTTLRKMLCNYTYVGCVHQGMRTTRNYKDRKTIYLDINDHIIVENMHEPIIDRTLFEAVQKILNSHIKARTANHREYVYLFCGLLRCESCGSGLSRYPTRRNGKEYVYYRCRRYSQGHKGCAHPASIRHDHVYHAVMHAVQRHIESCIALKHDLLHSDADINADVFEYKERISQAKAYMENQGALKCAAYEDWKLGVISKDDYLMIRREVDCRTQKQKEEIKRMQNRIDFCFGLMDTGFIDEIISCRINDKLTRNTTVKLIHSISIKEKSIAVIEFNNSERIDALYQYLSNLGVTI